MAHKNNPIKRGRKKTGGLTSQELADLMNVSRQTISLWENKKAVPDVHRIIELARRLDLPLEELILFFEKEETEWI